MASLHRMKAESEFKVSFMRVGLQQGLAAMATPQNLQQGLAAMATPQIG